MKYGVCDGDKMSNSKRKWRGDIEYEIGTLKTEMAKLKTELRSVTSKISGLATQHSRFRGNREWPTTSVMRFDDVPLNRKFNFTYTHEFSVEPQQENRTGGFRKEEIQTPKFGTRCHRPSFNSTPTVEDISDNIGSTLQFGNLNYITSLAQYRDWSFEELRVADYKIASPRQHKLFIDYGLKGVFAGTLSTKFKPTCAENTRINCISVQLNKSLEELRLEDYILKGYIKATINSTRALENLQYGQNEKKPFIIDYSNPNVPLFNKTTVNTPVAENLADPAANIQRLSTSGFVKPHFFHQHIRTSDFGTNERQPNNLNFPATINKDEQCLQHKILSKLEKIDTHFSYIDHRLSNMEGTLSEVNTQVSMIDSRLSNVDMFLMMQRVKKKWKNLGPSLLNLENTPERDEYYCNDLEMEKKSHISSEENPPTCIESTVLSDNTSPITSEAKADSLIGSFNCSNSCLTVEMANNSSNEINEDITSCVSKPKSALDSVPNPSLGLDSSESETDNSSCINPDEMNSTIYQGISTDVSKLVNDQKTEKMSISPGSPASPKIKSKIKCLLKIEEKKLLKSSSNVGSITSNDGSIKEERSLNIDVNNGSLDCSSSGIAIIDLIENNVDNSGPVVYEDNINQVNLKSIKTEEDKCKQEINSNEIELHNPNIQGRSSDEKNNEEHLSDAENDFVIVERSDVEFPKQDGNGETRKLEETQPSSAIEYKVCNNITEYLEVNLGKRKDLVYEFGFEAKPHSSLFDPALNSSVSPSKQNSPVVTSNNDDSFVNFMSNFIENHCVKDKQSSPLVPTEQQKSDGTGNNPKTIRTIKEGNSKSTVHK